MTMDEQEQPPWHDDDAFWEALTPFLFNERRQQSAPAEVDSALALLGIGPGAPVLDLACGVGRHTRELARRGFAVTGVDRTAAYLQRAREQAQAEGLAINFVQEDMRRFVRLEAFDAVLSLWTSFGYFDSDEENAQVLRNVHASLRPGGVFLLDLIGKETLARNFRERNWETEPDGALFLQERAIMEEWTRIETRWILIPPGEGPRRDLRFTHTLYGSSDLRALLLACGFASVAIFGSLEGAPYDHQARRLVAVARKI